MNESLHPLFSGVSEDECRHMLRCLGAAIHPFRAGEPLLSGDGRRIGLILRGQAELVRIERDGGRTVLELLPAGGLFGEPLAFSAAGDSLVAVGLQNGEAMFLDYDRLSRPCGRVCPCHTAMIDNLFRLLSEKSRRLSERIEVISRRSIREKLLCYCRLYAGPDGDSFELPFSLSALAAYICADRSAMMRELKRMREEGLLSFEKRRVRLNLNKS